MELSQEFIEKNQLNADQVTAFSQLAQNHIATLEQSWSKKANENAEGILSGAWKKVEEITGIQRNQGEKYADALSRASSLYFEGQKTTLERKQQELESKLKDSKLDESLKAELQSTKDALTALKQKEAQYDEWAKEDYKGKFETTSQKLTAMERRVAFKDVMPAKPENINEYEWKAKWQEWQTDVLDKNHLVFDEEGNAWAVDKQNEFKKTKLSDLAKQNESLQSMLKAREQKGLGSNGKTIDIEGVPFKLPENATPQERQKAIKDYLASQNIPTTDARYSAKFAELNAKILGLGKKQA